MQGGASAEFFKQAQEDEDCFEFKVKLEGDSGTGKSAILSRFARNEFSPEHKASTCLEMTPRVVSPKINGGKYRARMKIWDLPGQQKYLCNEDFPARDAEAIIFVYDTTKKETFNNIEKWFHYENAWLDYEPEQVVRILVGNKSDLRLLREVSTEEAKRFAGEHSMLFFETSALEATHVELLFKTVAGEVLRRAFEQEQQQRPAQQEDESSRLESYKEAIYRFVDHLSVITPTTLDLKRIQRKVVVCESVQAVQERVQEMKDEATYSPAILEKLNRIFDEKNQLISLEKKGLRRTLSGL
ncbi:MAG TPA: GTP-binding protein [Gammaproteobacteria bacterium]|nr:GTP-binding protein [Gammaproteobacteria bacterium]